MWPHKIAAAVYAPVDASGRVVCLDRWGRPREQGWLSALLQRAGLGSEACAFAGWSKARLRHHVRGVQQRAQARGERLLLVPAAVVQMFPLLKATSGPFSGKRMRAPGPLRPLLSRTLALRSPPPACAPHPLMTCRHVQPADGAVHRENQ